MGEKITAYLRWTPSSRVPNVTETEFAPIPSTLELLGLLKRPRKERSKAAKIERWCLVASGIIALLILVAAGLGFAGILTKYATRYCMIALLVAFVGTFFVWAITQFVDMFLTLKDGYRKAAGQVDEDILIERAVIAGLTRCEPAVLREHGKQLDLKAKLLTRRSQMGTVLAAVGAVVINLQAAGENAAIWGKFQFVPPLVLAGSFGVLIGSAALIMFAGQLERLSGLLTLAAERLESKKM
jgi:hypothetical protein